MRDPKTSRRGTTKQRDRARSLRRELTGPERRLWALLRSRQLDGIKFRRQQIIGAYVVDFYCPQFQSCR